jgi:hypothetical protein
MLSCPKKKREKCSLSMLHAIAMHPFMVTMTDITMKSIPVESKNRKGRKSLHKIVKMGENRNMTRVFLPIK